MGRSKWCLKLKWTRICGFAYVVLIARRQPLCEKLAREIRENYSVDARVICADLSTNVITMADDAKSATSDIDMRLALRNARQACYRPFSSSYCERGLFVTGGLKNRVVQVNVNRGVN